MASELRPLLPRKKTKFSLSAVLSCYHYLRHLCIPSKAVILIILWTAVIGIVLSSVTTSIAIYNLSGPHAYNTDVISNGSIMYAFLAITMIFYPLSGFIPDVCCGRFKTVMISLCFI